MDTYTCKKNQGWSERKCIADLATCLSYFFKFAKLFIFAPIVCVGSVFGPCFAIQYFES